MTDLLSIRALLGVLMIVSRWPEYGRPQEIGSFLTTCRVRFKVATARPWYREVRKVDTDTIIEIVQFDSAHSVTPAGSLHRVERIMDSMMIELLVVPECPHESAAVEVLTKALADVGLGFVEFTVTVIDSQDDADRRHFIGSPTICVDGEDVFPEPERPASVACRTYPGLKTGVPELRDLRQALKRAAALSTSRRAT